MLTSIYNIKEISITDLFSQHPSYNSCNFALHSLIKRKLVEQLNQGKYIKQVQLTVKGKHLVEELGFGTNEIKFTTTFGNLKAMLNKLCYGGGFILSVFTVKDGTLFSYQDSFSNYREAVFRESYFNEIKGNRTVAINTDEILSYIPSIPTTEIVTVETKDNYFIMHTKTAGIVHSELERLNQVKYYLKPMLSKVNGIPSLDSGKTLLDTHFSIKVADLKAIARSTKKESYSSIRFFIKDKKINVEISRDYNQSTYRLFETNVEVFGVNDGELKLGNHLSSIAKIFTQDMIHIYTKPDCPTWVYEESKDYSLGVLLIN